MQQPAVVRIISAPRYWFEETLAEDLTETVHNHASLRVSKQSSNDVNTYISFTVIDNRIRS